MNQMKIFIQLKLQLLHECSDLHLGMAKKTIRMDIHR